FKDSPQPTPPGMLQPGFEEKVMHASFRIGDNIVMASDGCNDDSGFKGFSLWLGLATISETESAFNALSDGGKITMALAPTFWSPMYGMLTDRFGVNWMVSVVEPQN
ncbi:MAG: VOC family protein, partial [Moraxellaceae bacterium]